MEGYPADLPCPKSVVSTPAERRLLSDIQGRRQARRLSSDYLARERIDWPLLTESQALAFQAWWRNVLVSGGAWFSADWPSPQGGAVVRRFLGAPQWAYDHGGAHKRMWSVSAECEVRGSSIIPLEGTYLVLDMQFEGEDGSNVFIDGRGHGVSTNGPVVVSTEKAYSGLSSAYFNGSTSGSIEVDGSEDFNFGAETFAIRARVNPSNVYGNKFIVSNTGAVNSSEVGFSLFLYGAAASFVAYNPAHIAFVNLLGGTVHPNQWNFIDVRRLGNKYKMSVNGRMADTATSDLSPLDSPFNLMIGTNPTHAGHEMVGHIDSLRMYKGGLR